MEGALCAHCVATVEDSIDILCGILSGSDYGKHVGPLWDNAERAQNLGLTFAVINVSAFADLDAFKSQVDVMIDGIKGSRKSDKTHEIFVPGELEFGNAEMNRKLGIPVGPGVLKDLTDLKNELHIDINLTRSQNS